MDSWISYDLKVKIASSLIVLFSAGAIIIFFTILLIKAFKVIKKIRDTKFKNHLENLLNITIAEFEDYSEIQKSYIKDQLSEKITFLWQKQIMIDLLIHYHSNLNGHIQNYTQSLFFDLNLQDLALRDLKKGNLKMKVRAMRNLSEIRYQQSWVEIIQFINHPRKLLRVEATVALINITKYPLFFLDNLKYPLTRWQIINMYKKIKDLPDEKLPHFEKWLSSSNESVQVFCIEMIARFNQSEAMEKVAFLTSHSSERIQISAISTLNKLSAFEHVDKIKIVLEQTDNTTLQTLAIQTIGDLAIDTSFNELVSSFLDSPELKVRFAAVVALNKLEGGDVIIAESMLDKHELIQPILEHLKDPLLN